MKVYLTGIDLTKTPREKSKNQILKSSKSKFYKEETNMVKEETNDIKENEISSEQVKLSFVTSKNATNKTNQLLNNNGLDNIETNKINNNNYISKEDKNINKKTKKIFKSENEFSQIRKKNYENQKNHKYIENQLKDDFVEYMMFKEPKYADFDKISDEYQKQLYISYQKYNNNLLIIERKKAEVKNIVSIIEKSLVNNYFLKDSSMLPVYEKLIEKVKLDILTKKQEHDGYQKLYEELYNKNYTVKRKVLDEIEIDTVNNKFYDQYKILKNHAIVQVSKKQEILNQVEDYHKKMWEDYEKEFKSKNKMLKDLQLHIEVFKEDEKDLINKLTKIKQRKEEAKQLIIEKNERNEAINKNIKYLVGRYHKSYISMNKIFKSVNAKNLDDVLYDVNYIKHNFNQLKNRITEVNQDITNLNNEYNKLCIQLDNIKKEISNEEQKKKSTYKREDRNRVEEINQELKKLNEDKYKIKEIIQKNIGTFQKGIVFLFQKTKLCIKSVKPLKKVISSSLSKMIKKYKNIPFSVNYNNIDKDFLKNFAYIFFKFCHVIFYLYLNSMSSGININNLNEKYELRSLYNKDSLKIYEAGIKKSLQIYDRRIKLKKEKQKEINTQIRKKEMDKKLRKKNEENNITTQNKIFKKFLYYLNNKNSPPSKKHKSYHNNEYLNSKESSKNSTSFFFTGIDFAKASSKNNKDSSKNNSLNETRSKFMDRNYNNIDIKGKTISYRDKKDYLMRNQNRFKNMFYKYQNILIKENERNLYFQKKNQKDFPRSKSQPKINFFKNNFPLTSKTKKEETSETKLPKPNLIDEDYEYDEDENDLKNQNILPSKKDKSLFRFTFFRFNRDRANIYKKMNDLRKLQMAYFGGRFLNTNDNQVQNSLPGVNAIFDEAMNKFHKKQSQDNVYDNKKMKKSNFKKKLVEKLTANRKLRDKSSFFIKRRNSSLKPESKSNINSDSRYRSKFNFSILNKKSTIDTTKNDRSINKYSKKEQNIFRKLYSKSVNNFIKNNKSNKNIKAEESKK